MLKSSPTTQLVSQIVLSGGRTISYEYDAEERITKVTDSVDGVTEYTYDALGQLLTEKHDGTAVNSMEYDNYGNIKSKNGVAYTYGDSAWKDLLTAVGNQTIVYDAQGNPTSYLGHTLTWEKGRQLKSFDNITYTYNANGIRTSKTVNGVSHTFALEGDKVLHEQWNNSTLVPLYDNEESVCGILYNNETFYFQKNLQGDIVGIVDKDAIIVAKYLYDAWGAPTIVQDFTKCGIAQINPYRYRGYYFDNETGMYYLQSRYYDPAIGRFVCGDLPLLSVVTTNVLEHNLFSYCENAPIMNIDPAGYELITIAVLGEIVLTAMIVLVLMYMLMAIVNSPEFQRSWSGFCTAVGNSFSSAWHTITQTAGRAWSWTKQQMRSFARTLSDAITVARATSRVISAIKTIRNTYTNFYEIYYYGALPIIGKK